jgi:YebC/PmpR family DNA-binding regulatory protein
LSGHSKWATIKRHKAVVDQKRGAAYAKMAREIIVAAKMGGPDPAANFRLRTAIERAKAEGVPNDNIARAVEKGSGSGGADNFEELTYEGYGPGGIAILVKCATDNRHRTAADLRMHFSKNGGNMGEAGCVNWMFTERGEVTVSKETGFDEDALLMVALDAGADDLDTTQDTEATVVCGANQLESVKEALQKAGYKVMRAESVMAPSNTIQVESKDTAKQLLKLLDQLESHDDVQQVYANFDMAAEWMQELL